MEGWHLPSVILNTHTQSLGDNQPANKPYIIRLASDSILRLCKLAMLNPPNANPQPAPGQLGLNHHLTPTTISMVKKIFMQEGTVRGNNVALDYQ